MNKLKKALGVIWFLLGPVFIYFLVMAAINNIDHAGEKEIHNPVIWIIIIAIFLPIAIGLMVFGWFAIKGEYDKIPESSKELLQMCECADLRMCEFAEPHPAVIYYYLLSISYYLLCET